MRGGVALKMSASSLTLVCLGLRLLPVDEQLRCIMLAEEGLDNEKGRCPDEGHRRQQLADADACPGEIQAVRPQTLDEHPAKAVPSHVHRGNLPIIFTPLGIKMQQDKAQQVPAGFIQKGRVIVSNVTHRVGQAHAQEAVGLVAVEQYASAPGICRAAQQALAATDAPSLMRRL